MEIRSAEEFREVFRSGKICIACNSIEERYDALITLQNDGYKIQPELLDGQFRAYPHPVFSGDIVAAARVIEGHYEYIKFADFMELFAPDTSLDVDISDDVFQSVLIV